MRSVLNLKRHCPCQWRYLKAEPPSEFKSGRGAEIMPVKDLHTRIKPFTLASGHGRYRYIAVTVSPERALASIGGWPLYDI
jgi:hypothetical protein